MPFILLILISFFAAADAPAGTLLGEPCSYYPSSVSLCLNIKLANDHNVPRTVLSAAEPNFSVIELSGLCWIVASVTHFGFKKDFAEIRITELQKGSSGQSIVDGEIPQAP